MHTYVRIVLYLNDVFLFMFVELGEIFRRAMWNIFRIEWEIIVQQDRSREKEIKPAAGISRSSASLLSFTEQQ